MGKVKIPKKLGDVADLLYKMREDRLALERQVDEVRGNERTLKEHLLAKFSAGGITSVAGTAARANLQMISVPTAEDWAAIEKHILKTGEFDLLQRRLGDRAVKERWEAGKEVPGVGRFTKLDITLGRVN